MWAGVLLTPSVGAGPSSSCSSSWKGMAVPAGVDRNPAFRVTTSVEPHQAAHQLQLLPLYCGKHSFCVSPLSSVRDARVDHAGRRLLDDVYLSCELECQVQQVGGGRPARGTVLEDSLHR